MSEIAVVDITLGGTPLFADDGTRLFWFVRGHPGSPPVVRGSDIAIPHAAGQVPASRIGDYLEIELGGWETAPEGLGVDAARAAFSQGVRELLALFSSASTSIVTLEALLEDGATATIDVRCVPPVLEKVTVPGLAAEFNVELRSIDPAWSIVDGS